MSGHVTILGRGDLSPPRRRHHRRRWPFALLLLVALGAGGWYGWHWWQDRGTTASLAPAPCVTPSHPPAPSAAASVRLVVLNATNRVGLAHDVATQLHRRGFRIARIGNNASTARTTMIGYPEGSQAGALAVAEQLPNAGTMTDNVRLVTLVIGNDFHKLATPKQAALAHQHDETAAHPPPPACASPAATP